MIAARIRRARLDRDGEDGYTLMFVLFVVVAITTAVATLFAVVTPNITGAKHDQDGAAALAAAYAGIDDFVAYLSNTNGCRTRICAQALGNSSAAAARVTTVAGTGTGTGTTAAAGERFSWTSDAKVTTDNLVRVHATGMVGTLSRTVTADIALTSPFLNFGYYTDYESQSPDFLNAYWGARNVRVADSGIAGQINAADTTGKTFTVTAPDTATWTAPPTTGNYTPNVCGQHWYAETTPTGTALPGRASYPSPSFWTQQASIASHNVSRYATCDVVFTSGMTFDGPIYTRDAMLISDGTYGGVGPIFKGPVSTLWGTSKYNTPAAPATPWRRDANVGGVISPTSPYSPALAASDLQLPTNVATGDLPDNACIYYGPTRVKLNGDGTATITSPGTTVRAATSATGCYPTSLTGGIVNFTLNYATVGNGTIAVQNLGTKPAAGWGTTARKNVASATYTPSATNSVFYLTNSAGNAVVDQSNSYTASTGCTSSVTYSAAAGAACAWTNLATATDAPTGSPGWTAYTTSASKTTTAKATLATDAARCGAFPSTTSTAAVQQNRELFECEYSATTGNNLPPNDQYGALRTAIATAVNTANASAGTSCVTGTIAAQTACIKAIITAQLARANSTGTTRVDGDHQYVVSATTTGTGVTGAAQAVTAAAPAAPMNGDAMYTNTSTKAQEAPTTTPITFTIGRQRWNGTSKAWDTAVPQFSTTFSQKAWAITAQASGVSYFPAANDVTPYGMGVNGANATSAPGDLYVEGNNTGVLSLVADNDVVVTGNTCNKNCTTSPDDASVANAAIDIVAARNVRNYHPVSCVDTDTTVGGDIDKTSSGWCPNDITGLYTGTALENNGALTNQHPALQYSNLTGTGARRIDAAVFTLSGSFITDNVFRGPALGNLTVNGGLYQSHRGANGVQWEYKKNDATRAQSGYTLSYHYVDLQNRGLPYTPSSTTATSRPWNVVSVSSGSAT